MARAHLDKQPTDVRRMFDTVARRYDDERAHTVYGVALEMLVALRADPAGMQAMLAEGGPERQELAGDLELRAQQAGETLPLSATELATAVHACISGLLSEHVHTRTTSEELFGYVLASLWRPSC